MTPAGRIESIRVAAGLLGVAAKRSNISAGQHSVCPPAGPSVSRRLSAPPSASALSPAWPSAMGGMQRLRLRDAVPPLVSGRPVGVRGLVAEAAARSVAAEPPRSPTAFDHLFAALAPRSGWVQSPGSVDNASARLAAAGEVVFTVGVGANRPADAAESMCAALLLGRLCHEAGKSVSFALDPRLPATTSAKIARSGFGLQALNPGATAGPDAVRAVTRPGGRLVLAFEPDAPAGGARPASGAGRPAIPADVSLSRYPRASEVLARAQSQMVRASGEPLAYSDSRVSAPTAGSAGLAVATRFAAAHGLERLVPSAQAYATEVAAMRASIDADTAARSGSTAAPAARDTAEAERDAHLLARAELIRAIGLSEAGAAPSTRLSPYLVAAFDSSNGGIIAARNAAGFMTEALRKAGVERDVKFVIVADHANAPYGSKSAERLRYLVTAGLTGSALLRPDAIMMACNTACTAFPQAERAMRSSQDTHVPVIDLIDVTVGGIIARGGAQPGLLSTVATCDSRAYQARLVEAGRPHTALGCDGWADLVNRGAHQSALPDDIKTVRETVRERVAELKRLSPDLSSVWLCCTHYPALKPQIEQELRRQFPHRTIPVHDPMQFQAERVAEQLLALGAPREVRGQSDPFTVLTTGRAADVRLGSDALLAPDRAAVRQVDASALSRDGVLDASDAATLGALRRATLGLPASGRDALLGAYVQRGVNAFAVAGGARALAASLSEAGHVMLLTGFSVGSGLPETDGPPGTAVLAKTLLASGKDVTIVVDPGNEAVMRASMAAITAAGGKAPRIRVFESEAASAETAAGALLASAKPDAVVAIELPGRNAQGQYLNMRGVDIGGFNAPVDAVLMEATRAGTFTAGIGDGGNEAGIGHLPGIPAGRFEGRSFAFASSVPSELGVTAWNSNFGAIATAMELAHQSDTPGAMPTSADIVASIEGSVAAGAVDGVTREPTASVDGFSHGVHTMFADLYLRALLGPPGGGA
jgi:glutamate racemase